jgi:hypothetical protein
MAVGTDKGKFGIGQQQMTVNTRAMHSRYVNGLRGVVIASREVRMVWTRCMKFERCATRPR